MQRLLREKTRSQEKIQIQWKPGRVKLIFDALTKHNSTKERKHTQSTSN